MYGVIFLLGILEMACRVSESGLMITLFDSSVFFIKIYRNQFELSSVTEFLYNPFIF